MKIENGQPSMELAITSLLGPGENPASSSYAQAQIDLASREVVLVTEDSRSGLLEIRQHAR